MPGNSAVVPLPRWVEFGDPAGTPLLYHHGMPGAHPEAAILHGEARRHGLRLIVPDRPGIGLTPFRPRASIAELVGPCCALLDHLGIDQCHQVGWSSGGPVALAMAALAPERVPGVTLMASYTHFHESGRQPNLVHPLSNYAGFVEGRLAERLSGLVRLLSWTERVLPWLYLRFLQRLCSPADREILADRQTRRLFMAAQAMTFRQGVAGPRQDLGLPHRDWGFRLADVKAAVTLYQGEDDPFVTPANADDLATRLPCCELSKLAGEGHLFPLRQSFQQRWMAGFSTLRRAKDEPIS